MIVLGVDPGTSVTGYGVVRGGGGDRPTLLECGAIRPGSRQPLAKRLQAIFQELGEIIDRVQPDVVSVEGVFYGPNVRTTVVLGHARGVVLLAAALRDLPVAEYPPAEIKNAVVGTGMAQKRQVALMVQEHLGLDRPPRPSDAADGAAVALCHLFLDLSPARSGRRSVGGVGRKLGRDQSRTR